MNIEHLEEVISQGKRYWLFMALFSFVVSLVCFYLYINIIEYNYWCLIGISIFCGLIFFSVYRFIKPKIIFSFGQAGLVFKNKMIFWDNVAKLSVYKVVVHNKDYQSIQWFLGVCLSTLEDQDLTQSKLKNFMQKVSKKLIKRGFDLNIPLNLMGISKKVLIEKLSMYFDGPIERSGLFGKKQTVGTRNEKEFN